MTQQRNPLAGNPRRTASHNRRRLLVALAVLDDLADQGPVAWHNVKTWAPSPIPTAKTTSGPRSSSEHDGIGRPTEKAAYQHLAAQAAVIDTMDKDLADYTAAVDEVLRLAGRLAAHIRIGLAYHPDEPLPGTASVDDENSRAGLCGICRDPKRIATGRGNDRLRLIVFTTTTRRDEEATDRILACDPCRKAWARRPDGQTMDDFIEERRA